MTETRNRELPRSGCLAAGDGARGRVLSTHVRYPKHELYSLTSQTRRAATSIASNVAEGKARQTTVYRNHVSIALGSQAELDTVLELAVRLKCVDEEMAVVTRHLEERRPNAPSPAAALERKILEASKPTSDGRTRR